LHSVTPFLRLAVLFGQLTFRLVLGLFGFLFIVPVIRWLCFSRLDGVQIFPLIFF